MAVWSRAHRAQFVTEEDLQARREYYAAYRATHKEKLKQHQAKWRSANRDLAKERVLAWIASNPNGQREAEAKYRKNNPEKRKESCAKYRNANAESERTYRKLYSATHKPQLCARAAKRRALKRKAQPAWATDEELRTIYQACREITEATGEPHHVDHIVPLKSAQVCGLHCPANLQILPGIENLSKGNRWWPDM